MRRLTREDQQAENEGHGESDESSADGGEVRLRGELLGLRFVFVGEGDDVAPRVDGVVAGMAPGGSIGK
jgi:hypothetical protein